MFGPKISVTRELLDKLETCAAVAGYSSGREFAIHVLEREVAKIQDTDSSERIEERLRGLGYIS